MTKDALTLFESIELDMSKALEGALAAYEADVNRHDNPIPGWVTDARQALHLRSEYTKLINLQV